MNGIRLQFQLPQMLPWVMLGIILVLGAIIVRRRVSMLAGFGILRGGALIALLISLARPVIVRPSMQLSQGPVVVMVDRSRSMSVADPGRSTAQCVALADIAGLIAPQRRPIVAPDLIASARALLPLMDSVDAARSEREFAQLSGRGMTAADRRFDLALSALHDAATAMMHQTSERAGAGGLSTVAHELSDETADRSSFSTNGGNAINRLRQTIDAAQSAAAAPQADADRQLYQSDPYVHEAADQVKSMPRIDVIRAVLSRWVDRLPDGIDLRIVSADASLTTLDLENDTDFIADGNASDFDGALAALRREMSAAEPPIAVLFSDGRSDLPSAVTRPTPFPIVAIESAAALQPDLSIVDATVPTEVNLHETTTVRAVVAASGLHDQPIDLTVDDGETIGSVHVEVSDGQTTVAIPVRFDHTGSRDVTIRATPKFKELRPDGCVTHREVQVSDGPMNVLLIEGHDKSDGVEEMLNANAGWIHSQTLHPPFSGGELTDHMQRAAIILLDGCSAKSLSASQWEMIAAKASAGRSVVFIASTDLVLPLIDPDPGLAKLLPWRAASGARWRNWPLETPGFQLRPVAATSLTRIVAEPAENRRRWEQIPGLQSVLTINALKPGVNALMAESGSGQAVVTEMRINFGHVLFVGTPDTGRWEAGVLAPGEQPFLIQLLRFAAPKTGKVVSPPQDSAEMANVEPDEANLRRMADASGGILLPIEQADELTDRLAEIRTRTPRSSTYLLWDSAALYFLVLGCMTLDWTLRKHAGLL